MPEYLAPGVFVEETSFRSKSIEGVSTTTTGFIGPARTGPVDLAPDIITSLGAFEEVYGDGRELVFDGGNQMTNYLWQAVRAFFTNGGKRLYVSRTFKPKDGPTDTTPKRHAPIDPNLESVAGVDIGTGGIAWYQDGCARAATLLSEGLVVRARHPGAFGNNRVRFSLKASGNILSAGVDPITRSPRTSVGALKNRDLVWAADRQSPHDPTQGSFYLAQWNEDQAIWEFDAVPTQSPGGALTLDQLFPAPDIAQGDAIRVVTLGISVLSRDGSSEIGTWTGLPFDPEHRTGSSRDSVFDYFATVPNSASDAIRLPLVVARDSHKIASASDVLLTLFGTHPAALLLPNPEEAKRHITVADKLAMGISVDALLDGGNDGERPGAGDYEGEAFLDKHYALGLKQFEDIDDISIVAAPGSTWDYAHYSDDADAIQLLLIAHAESMRYRIAVLDSAEGQSIAEIRTMRARLDSKYAALYYPWVTVLDPVSDKEIDLPPSGFVAGIYARNDIQRAVYKAPANEVVSLALGFETLLNKAQQEVLNPEGINCFRFFEGRGMRLWGARLISSDPEWKYVNLRRYFAYLEHSIDKSTQWAVFEPNGERLWANLRRTVADFLLNEWQNGALLGDKPEKAFFVRCDRSTMTQNDLDNGRLVCLIGVAPLYPAEFVIFRIGQWTADAKS
jgi:phage tail sheath protein FI